MKQDLENREIKHAIDTLTAFAHVASVSVTLYDSEHKVMWECYPEKKLCSIFSSKEKCCEQCPRKLVLAEQTAVNIEEAYIFLCEAGMIKILYPLIINNVIIGFFFVGPVAMGNSRDNVIMKLLKKLAPIDDCINEVLPFLERLEFRTPHEINYLYEVFCNCVLSNRLIEGRERFTSNNSVEEYESDNKEIHRLLYLIKTANRTEAIDCFKTLCYDKFYIMEAGNLNKIKVDIKELFLLLIKNLSNEDILPKNYKDQIKEITHSISFAEAYETAQRLIEQIIDQNSSMLYLGNSNIIKSSLTYINENHGETIDLKKVASEINVNPSYFSTLFRKEMGITFSKYLMQIRLKSSVIFLKNTHYSITEISMLCGFSGQSYFIKCFRERYSMTPNEYRKKIKPENNCCDIVY